MQHYQDLEMIKEFEDQHTYLTIQEIVKETISKKASDPQASPLMAGAVFRAVFRKHPLPSRPLLTPSSNTHPCGSR